MSKLNKTLAGLLAIQCVLVILSWVSSGSAPTSDATPLFEAEATAITELSIQSADEGVEAESVTLKRDGDGWVASSHGDYPAKTDKVEDIVDKILSMRHKAPIATHAANHAALSVSATTFDRKLSIKAAGKTVTVFLGNAKGNSAHARFEGEDTVYLARGVSNWVLSPRVSTYVDTAYLTVEHPVALSLTGGKAAVNLTKRDDGGWSVAELPPETETDDAKLRTVLEAAKTLRLVEPVGKTVKPEYGLDAGLTITLRDKAKTTTVRLGAKIGELMYAKAEDLPYVVKVRASTVEPLLTATPQSLIKEPDAPEAQPGMPGGFPGGIPGMPGGMPGMPR